MFQSFFSGKLFGKIPFFESGNCRFGVSILLLWKVIWKVTTVPARGMRSHSFNPSSLESYLERSCPALSSSRRSRFQSFFSGKLFGKDKSIESNPIANRVSILLLWKVIWKGKIHRLLIQVLPGFQSFFSGKLFGKIRSNRFTRLGPNRFQSFFSGKLFGKPTAESILFSVFSVSILLLWKVIWKVVLCLGSHPANAVFQSFFSGKLFGKHDK